MHCCKLQRFWLWLFREILSAIEAVAVDVLIFHACMADSSIRRFRLGTASGGAQTTQGLYSRVNGRESEKPQNDREGGGNVDGIWPWAQGQHP